MGSDEDRPGYAGFILLKALLLAGLCVWGWTIAHFSIAEGEMGGSFMHAILLPFHEAGHVLFAFMGDFMHVAGGTIGQLAMPVVAAIALQRGRGDSFGAAVAVWWLACSLMDVAPYAWDALEPRLILLGGQTGEDGPHDWIQMLNAVGRLQSAHAVGQGFHRLGAVTMIVALAWAAGALMREWSQRER